MLPFLTFNEDQIKRLREGDSLIFQQIYQDLAPKIYRLAYSFLKDKVQSEEVVQEAFIVFWENRQAFEIGRPIEPYLFTVSKRLVMDSFRKATSTNALREKLMLKISEKHNETEDKIILSDLMAFAEKAIQDLPRQQQIVFRLSRFEGLSYDEIGERLNLSKNTVKNHLVVAVKTLKTQFSSHEMIYFLLVFVSLF